LIDHQLDHLVRIQGRDLLRGLVANSAAGAVHLALARPRIPVVW
jgi:hypothetical protein